ncbi:Ig-like domain-containing protein [Clostridium sp. OS1-26]|uniref:Ig-like domain-containing protein n=1 Tax=Clostridium sp. OS1-26 TaxID=3070681 RepID=UPI0027E0E63F|nr:Ig-like domain-containing protein [Clostridium sp. OS1-26]WML36732.1 Ig-like domain-containing protein [Clostridium sp. OS1-26]
MRKKYYILNIIFIMMFLLMSMNANVLADPTVKVVSISLNKTSDTLSVGGTDNLTVTINPSNATEQSVRWASSNTNVATVFNGVVMAIAPGTAVITATSEDGFKSAACMVTVTNPIITVSLDKTSEIFTVGETGMLKATVTKTNMDRSTVVNQMVTFKSSNNDVMQVGGNGFVYAAGPGTATITASTEGGSNVAACFVTVNAKNNTSSLVLSKKAAFIVVGGTDKLTASVVSTGTVNPVVNWTSSDPNVVKVLEGILLGMNPGTAVITATTADGTSTATCSVTVYTAGTVPISLQSISLNKTSTKLTVGASETLTAALNPANATNYSLVWKSSNPNVASVNGNGVVSALSAGSTLITVSTSDGTISSSCTVTVADKSIPASTINTTRLGGSDRYETSVAISKSNWKGTSTYAVLASGNGFADGLSSAALAKKYNAPILLTEKDSIPDSVLAEITRLHVTNVLITGGVGVVSQSVEKKLNSLGITTERIGGKDRYETSIKVAEKVGSTNGEVIIANGYQWTDALSISSIAAKRELL